MKLYPSFIIIIIFLLTLFSCQKVIDVNVDQGAVQLSVDGNISDKPGPYYVILSRTQKYFDNSPSKRVAGATVVISDSDGIIDTLKEELAGKYKTQKIQGKIGNNYNLYIKSAEFGEYTAQTMIRRAFKFDTIYSIREEDKFTLKEQYNVRYSYTDNKGIGDAVRIKIYLNNIYLNSKEDLTFYSDENVDGNQIKEALANRDPLKINDKVKVEILSITHDYLLFLTELEQQTNNGGLFSNPPANVRTNIFNKNPNGIRATGFFSGTSIVSKEVTVTK